MKLIERHYDVVTHDTHMEDLHTIQDFPVFMGCVDHPIEEDVSAELTWQINKNSGLLQLKKLIPLDVLYQAQHESGVVGFIWMEHHRRFAEFLYNFLPSAVFELGGAHGILSKEFSQLKDIPWTILEPNPAPIQGCKANFIQGFFDEKFKYSDSFDTLVHSHVFEHIYCTDEFMKHLSRFMEHGQRLIFSVPNMQMMLQKMYTNCINFEHTVFLTEPYIEYLLAKYGFKILAKEYFMDDHSIFYATVRDSQVKSVGLPVGLYNQNKKLYLDYIVHHKTLIEELNKKISNTNQPIYLFGAHIFAQHLLKSGLNSDKILCLLDNDEKKQGRRLYGTKLMVASPKILSTAKDPVVILKAGVYNEEIRKDILDNINKSTVFIE